MTSPTTSPTSSEARKGEMVTTIGRGCTGIGYLVDGEVWSPSGSYWAVRVADLPGGLVEYIRDGGQAYLDRVKRLTGWG